MKQIGQDRCNLKHKLKNFEYLRQERVSKYQGIYVSFITAALLIIADLIAGEDTPLKIFLVLVFMGIALMLYRESVAQTQKPIFVCDNLTGTIEKGPHVVKDKDGQEYVIFGLSDIIQKERGLQE